MKLHSLFAFGAIGLMATVSAFTVLLSANSVKGSLEAAVGKKNCDCPYLIVAIEGVGGGEPTFANWMRDHMGVTPDVIIKPYDFRGSAAERWDAKDVFFTMLEGMVVQVARLQQEHPNQKILLIGYSFGAAAAQEIANRLGGCTEAMLIDPPYWSTFKIDKIPGISISLDSEIVRFISKTFWASGWIQKNEKAMKRNTLKVNWTSGTMQPPEIHYPFETIEESKDQLEKLAESINKVLQKGCHDMCSNVEGVQVNARVMRDSDGNEVFQNKDEDPYDISDDCYWKSKAWQYIASCEVDKPGSGEGEDVKKKVSAGKFTSYDSQEDANNQADDYAKALAIKALKCVPKGLDICPNFPDVQTTLPTGTKLIEGACRYLNKAQSYTAKCGVDKQGVGDPKSVTIPAAAKDASGKYLYVSPISQGHADKYAYDAAKKAAVAALKCTATPVADDPNNTGACGYGTDLPDVMYVDVSTLKPGSFQTPAIRSDITKHVVPVKKTNQPGFWEYRMSITNDGGTIKPSHEYTYGNDLVVGQVTLYNQGFAGQTTPYYTGCWTVHTGAYSAGAETLDMSYYYSRLDVSKVGGVGPQGLYANSNGQQVWVRK